MTQFERAAESRREQKVDPFGGGYTMAEDLIEFLKVKDHFRYRRVVREMRWVREQARKAGFPEHAIPWEQMT